MEAVKGIATLAPTELELGRLKAFGLRMRVWWAKDRLTRQLARGAASVDSRELALRAGQITAKRTREVVSDSLDELLKQATNPKPLFASQVPVKREKVAEVGPQLTELRDRLREPRPVRPQGMAELLLLLTDPERPLWGLASADELEDAIIEAREHLDQPTLEVNR
jgi:hypothetical protein